MKKHSKSKKFILFLLLFFAVGASGMTGYAVVTGQMPTILSTISKNIFSSSTETTSSTVKGVNLELDSKTTPTIQPKEILPSSASSTVESVSSIDPDVKIDDNHLSPQGDTFINPEPVSVTTSQDTTSTPPKPAPTSPSSDSSSAPDPAEPTPSTPPVSPDSSAPVPNKQDKDKSESKSHKRRPPAISGVSLDKTEIILNKGDISAPLISTITPSNATGNKTITWESANESIAKVDSFGHITAVSAGTTQIIAHTSNGKTAECKVIVLVQATGIKINSDNFSIDKDLSKTLTATVMPEDATDKTVIWATSNNDIVSVDETGKITAEKAGTATITATTGNGKFSTKCDVTVGISISSLILDKTQLVLIKGTEDTLTATIDPPDSTEDKTVQWTSSNKSVAMVDDSGKITALARGTTTITAEVGSHCAECVVTVIVPTNGVSLNKPFATLPKGTEEILIATIFPEDSTDKEVSWTSSDEAIATVDVSGKVTAVNVGTSVITVKSHDGAFTAECTVTVVIPVTGITIDKTELTLIKGTSESIITTISPSDATDQAVAWTSSDTNIATVNADGKITAVAGGFTTITVTTHDGNFTAECKVTVIVPVKSITVNKPTLTLVKGTEETLLATIAPDDATEKSVLWSSLNNDICTVDEDGKITAVNAGSTVITVKSQDGAFTAECKVTVVIPVTEVHINKATLTLVKGTEETLLATIAPDNATDKSVLWSSLNNDICTVDENGKVTAAGVGITTVRVTTNDGAFTAECAVSVTPDTYTITANSVNGQVNGAGTHHVGSTVTLTAVPNAHYHFIGWSDGVTTASRIITVTQDVNLTAQFVIDTFTVNATAGANGTVTGGGIYAYGSVITLNAIPNTEYHFVNWSDGNTDANRSLTVTGNVTLTANFKLNAIEWTHEIKKYGNTGCVYVGDDDNTLSAKVVTVQQDFSEYRGGGVEYRFPSLVLPAGSRIETDTWSDEEFRQEYSIRINGVQVQSGKSLRPNSHSSGIFNYSTETAITQIGISVYSNVKRSACCRCKITIFPAGGTPFILNFLDKAEQ